MEHEAEFYEAAEGGRVVCRLCPHGCRLAEGERGKCRSRVCRGGRLVAENYGRVCALQIDPVEKKPLLHFHPGGSCLSLAATFRALTARIGTYRRRRRPTCLTDSLVLPTWRGWLKQTDAVWWHILTPSR